ncbi:hypothetical protein TNCV_4405281 [Trichonephila clavipes]|uniref:Uncharacterized protein n=1 Tax=Trichonephila clavipes TaxID=2585209 RepID=A0A8X6S3M8_TRICX|nr:hypothetical protein TNCV_4405281 [Trichonephila clavipes]
MEALSGQSLAPTNSGRVDEEIIPTTRGISHVLLRDSNRSATGPFLIQELTIDELIEMQKQEHEQYFESVDPLRSEGRMTIFHKLHSIHPSTAHWAAVPVRKHDVRLTRLRIGHTRLTHRHLLLGKSSPVCDFCQRDLSI